MTMTVRHTVLENIFKSIKIRHKNEKEKKK